MERIYTTEDAREGTTTIHGVNSGGSVTMFTSVAAGYLRRYHPQAVARFFGRLATCPGCGRKVRGQHYCS